MKKLLLTIAIVAMLVCAFAVSASAADIVKDGIYYSTNDTALTATVSAKNATDCQLTVIDIPATFEYNEKTYTVTAIASSAFRSNKTIISITTPSTITSIGEHAFREADALVTLVVNASASFTTFANAEAYGCDELKTVDLSGCVGLKSLGGNQYGHTFHSCKKLETVKLPEGLTTIKQEVFRHCEKLSSINIPSTVTYIGNYAFQSCKEIREFDIPSGLTYLGCNNFQYSKVTRLILPGTLAQGSNDVFYDSTLQELVFAASDVSNYNSQFLNGTGSLKLIFYVGDDATTLTSKFSGISGWTNFVSYEQYLIDSAKADFTGYTVKTIVYGTDNCSGCYELATDETTFVYTDYLSKMYDNCICGSCGATSQVAEYKPMYRFQGYSAPEKNGVYAFCIGYSTNKESIKTFGEKTGKTVSFGVVAVATERITGGKTPLEMVGTVPVICAPIENQYGSVTLKINGFTEDQKSVALTMALYVTVTKGEETSTVYIQKTQSANPGSYSIAQYEADNVA